MREIARAGGMRVIGPIARAANFGSGASLSFSTMYIEAPPKDGPVESSASRSDERGAIRPAARTSGIGVQPLRYRNDCDVTVAELASVVRRRIRI